MNRYREGLGVVPTEGLSGSKVDYLNRLVRRKGSTFSLSLLRPPFLPHFFNGKTKGVIFPIVRRAAPFFVARE